MISKAMINKPAYYSDFYDKSYCKVLVTGIDRSGKGHNWFKCKVSDNSMISDKRYYAIGSDHTITDSWLYPTVEAMRSGSKAYQNTQIKALKALYYRHTGKRFDRH